MPLLTINSKSLFYTLAPSTSPTPSPLTLLFIHGLGSTSSYFAPITPFLTSAGHACLTVDTHGAGLSPYTGSGNSIASIAADALALLDALDIKQNVVVVGHSMGCVVASHIAATDKQRIKAVVLIGPVDPNPAAAEVFGKRIEIVEKDGMSPLAATIPTAATGSRSTPLVHAFIRTLLLGNNPAGYISLCRAIGEAATPDYKGIAAPVLILAGEEDKTAPLEGVGNIMGAYGSEKKELRILQGVGHWHVLEAWEEVQGFIGGFLGEI